MTKKTVYIAGPMRGIPYFNFPAFDAARDVLILEGHNVISPADMDRAAGFEPTVLGSAYDPTWQIAPGLDMDAAVTRDIEAVRNCDEIHMLKGWETSKGAKAEKALAEWLGKEVTYEFAVTVLTESDIRDCWTASEEALAANRGYEIKKLMPKQARRWGVFPDTVLPKDNKSRLDYPMCSGLLMYFPRACAAVARHSKIGNDQHNPGEPLHWAKEKSIGRGDQIVRHLVDGMTTWESDRDDAAEHFAGMHWRAAELHERFLVGLPPFERGK